MESTSRERTWISTVVRRLMKFYKTKKVGKDEQVWRYNVKKRKLTINLNKKRLISRWMDRKVNENKQALKMY